MVSYHGYFNLFRTKSARDFLKKLKCCLVLSVEQSGISTLRASSLLFSGFFFLGGGGGGREKRRKSLKSLLRISQARVSDIKNEFQRLYFNLYFSCLHLHFEFLCNFYQTKRGFLLLVGSKQPYNSRKKKRIVKYNIYSLP